MTYGLRGTNKNMTFSTTSKSFFIDGCRIFIKTDKLDRQVLFFLCSEGRIKSNLRRLFDWISVNSCADRWYRDALDPVFFGECKGGLVITG